MEHVFSGTSAIIDAVAATVSSNPVGTVTALVVAVVVIVTVAAVQTAFSATRVHMRKW